MLSAAKTSVAKLRKNINEESTMTQKERRIYLIRELLKEQPKYHDIEIKKNEQEQKTLL